MDAVKARENIDINGGDDVDNGVAINPQPTSTISKYITEFHAKLKVI